MAKRPKSEALSALHQTMQDLHSVGVIDEARLREFDEGCLDDGDAARLTFEVYKDKKSEWRWRLRSADGKIIASSAEGYKSRKACLAAIALVRTASSASIAA
jgi:uncharacterized protein YegP (UPF0339 family)